MQYVCLFFSIILPPTAFYLSCLAQWREGMPRQIKLLFVSVPYSVLGGLLHVLSLCCWIFVLTSFELSFAFPLLSLGYVLVFLFNSYKLKLKFSIPTMLGLVCILLGLFLIIQF